MLWGGGVWKGVGAQVWSKGMSDQATKGGEEKEKKEVKKKTLEPEQWDERMERDCGEGKKQVRKMKREGCV